MGDPAHQARHSDHNLGNAIDLSRDLADGFDVGALAEAFRRQMTSFAGGRISYVIFNARIASVQSDWQWKPYNGINPHRTHCHISIKAASRGQTRPWKLE